MKAGRILDVGCATGHFLSRFFHGGGWETWGVDLSKPAIIFAAAKNIRLHVGDTRSAKFPTGFFDVVTVLDTFYYFQEPLLELQEFKRILKPDGLLVIEVPLAGARLWRLTTRLGEFLGGGKRALFETNDHLFFYGTESLSRILVESEFVVLEMLPLRSNRQNVMMKDVLYFLYDILSRILWKLSGARVMLGPRLLVLARPR
jgi:SAM-dependent methyltransferase